MISVDKDQVIAREDWLKDYLRSLQLEIDKYPEEFGNDLREAFDAGWRRKEDAL